MLLLLFLSVPTLAQDACASFVTRINSFMELRDYNGAFHAFETAPADCAYLPKAYDNIEKVLRIRLDNASDSDKQAARDLLFAYYDKYDQLNPVNDKGHLIRKAKVWKRSAQDSAKAYQFLEKAYAQDRKNFTDAEGLYDYFTGYHAQYTSGKVTLSQLIERHSEISATLAAAQKTAVRKQPYRFAAKGINALMEGELNCENMLPVYAAQFDGKNDPEWLATAAGVLARKNCQSDTLYAAIVRSWEQAEASPESALALSEVESRLGNTDAANAMLDQAANRETDLPKKAEILYRSAMRLSGDPALAHQKLRQALEANPKMGRAHLLMATLYANSGCGKNEFERKALHYLALKSAMQAGAVQPELKASAEAEAGRYRKNLPSAQEIKASGLRGKSFKPDCWINEAVQIPSK